MRSEAQETASVHPDVFHVDPVVALLLVETPVDLGKN